MDRAQTQQFFFQVLNAASHAPQSQPATPRYSYKLGYVITPHKKSNVIVKHLHNISSKFGSVNKLHAHLVDEFQARVRLMSATLKASNCPNFGWCCLMIYVKCMNYIKIEVKFFCDAIV